MCMVDNADGHVTKISRAARVARVAHRCNECRRVIMPGESYLYETHYWDGEFQQHKTCAHCQVVRNWLSDECGGFLYGGVEEDIRDHAHDGYPMDVRRLAVGMSWKWSGKRGLLPIPKSPLTTHERLARKDQA